MENLSSTRTSSNKQQFSVERKPISVVSVRRPSDTTPSSPDTRVSTLERDPMSIVKCGKGFGGSLDLLRHQQRMWESFQPELTPHPATENPYQREALRVR
ncbi:zinc finger protein 165 [Phyllostomus discolor]|nr:zinc finger protein 165 [Phyllostomus discolor]